MNRFWTVVVSLLLVLGGGCQPTAPATPPTPSPKGPVSPANPGTAPVTVKLQPLLRWHSLGLQSLTNGTGGTRLKELVALPESGVLKSNTLVKLSHTLPAILFPEAPTNQDQAARLKPLLEDVLSYESKVVWASASPLRWRVAVKIPLERTGVWSMGLYDLLVRGEYLAKIPRTNITDTSVTVTYTAAETYRYGLKDGWVTVERAEPGYDWEALAKSEVPLETNALVALAVDTKILPNATAAFGKDNYPYARLVIEDKSDSLSSGMVLKFPKALDIKLQTWRVPANTIKDPVISFTAIQGFGNWWERQEWLKPFGLKEAPQQGYFWAQPEAPYQTFGVFQAKDASKLIASAVGRTNDFDAAATNRFFGRMLARTNELLWGGLPPFVIPSFKAAPEPQDDQILMALFPMARSKTDLPPELLKQFLGRPKLLYYDWEITELRLKQWLQMGPFISMILKRPLAANGKVPFEWLGVISTKLGNSVTEAELTADDEITIHRKSPIGMTGVELYLFARWLDQENLPRWDAPLDPLAKMPGVPTMPPPPVNPKK